MSLRYQAPRGTQDILPEEQPYWDWVRDTAARLAGLFGYGRIDTPVFEPAALFVRTTGEATDIVQKEMYVFQDRGGQELALRPEGTAPVCRAYLEHGLHARPQPVRLWYIAPIFRYDRPQAGRYRQHHQFGVEAIGDESPALDAEVIELLWSLYGELGLSGLTLRLNSIGDRNCRPAYVAVLREYYSDKLDRVCADCRDRFQRNPLRLLDCKQESCQPVIAGAPALTDHLCAECAEHFAQLRGYLDALGIPYELEPRLVRGFDYYTRTVFEVHPPVEGAQSAIGGGGRYDGLIEELGGPPTPAVGFGTGIERIILNLKRQEVAVPQGRGVQAFVAYQGAQARLSALRLASRLRRQGIATVVATGDRSLKAQMRQADARGARYALILGPREVETGTVTVRRLADGHQETLPAEEVVSRLRP
ncbi:Histidine--tRNA ligase [bacterium HR24]|nr:Histidine--tRNA ligase [bacterium HR24]